MSNQSDLAVLLQDARVAEAMDIPNTSGLRSRIGMRNYLRIAGEVSAGSSGLILDWGAGYGQMAWLLERRGMKAICYDVGPPTIDPLLQSSQGLRRVAGSHPVDLPFRSGVFDAALSCGVLEHVPEPEASLHELFRVLRPGGRLFIYNLPQKRSYKELVIRKLKLGYAHENTFTVASTTALLKRHGFRVLRSRRGGFLPHSLTGIPQRVKSAYNSVWPAAYLADRGLASVPLLNRIAEAVEIVAERPG
ncbi:MAG TPA: class I SAM-dependent methyltransferase [Actinomycetota bacterium]|nr:class I SAM-dependent methyltransferase [Actinomycetota bacterium]